MINRIYSSLQNIIKGKEYTRFHMPGHKGRTDKKIDWHKYDFTEVPGSDNLSNPDGFLLEVMNDISNIYGVRESFMLINGSTVGIIASILAACKPGESFVIPRNSHRSVYSALLLYDINPIYIYPNTENEYPMIDLYQVEKAFLEYPESKGIIITSPTYHGVCSDVRGISEIVSKHNKVLIVDEAHGAHLKFHNRFPLSSVELGADIVVQSTHKTLESFNQGALLHVCSDKVDRHEIRSLINMLQTSSPSYPIMISVEFAVKDAYKNGSAKLEKLIHYYDDTHDMLKDTVFRLEGAELLKKKEITDYDKSKLWISSTKITGYDLSDQLRERYNIQIEMWDNQSILAMMGMGTARMDIDKLIHALKEISKSLEHHPDLSLPKVVAYPLVKRKLKLRETISHHNELVPLSKSTGRISSEFIIPYPPGIPVLIPGEMIDNNVIEFINNWRMKDVVGITIDGNISVIK